MFASPPTLFIMKQIIGQKLLNDRNSIQNFIFVAGVFNFGQFLKRIRAELSERTTIFYKHIIVYWIISDFPFVHS